MLTVLFFAFTVLSGLQATAESFLPFAKCSHQAITVVWDSDEAGTSLLLLSPHEECGEECPLIPNSALKISAMEFEQYYAQDSFTWQPPGLNVETPPPKT